jgi:signal transduction histidine kinase
MSLGRFRRRSEALREKQRIILLGAAVTMLFAFADALALHRFSWATFGVRSLWAVLIVGTAVALPRVTSRTERALLIALALASVGFFGLLTWLTGGFGSPLFHWILAMPLVVAVVLQEYPQATLAAALATLVSGVTLAALDRQPPAVIVGWAVQALGMSALAVYASVTYSRLRRREQALREAGLLAEARSEAAGAAVKARDQFLSVASHELKTPLTALRLQLDRLVRRSAAEGTGDRALLPVVVRQVDRLAELVESLLDVSRIASGQLAISPEPGDLLAVVRQTVQRYGPLAQRQGSALSVTGTDGPLPGVFDGGRLEQVLSNLIGNAVKFGRGKPIEVGLAGRGSRAQISVRDQGIGVAQEDRVRIFDRFERAAPECEYGGLGLGLWISRRIVEQMGGKIEVESEVGAGTTFTVDLPLVAQASVAASGGRFG